MKQSNIFKQSLLLGVCILLCATAAEAQKKVDAELGVFYLKGKQKAYGKSLQCQTLYRFTDAVKLGAGVRVERLENYGCNTLPIFAATEISPIGLHGAFFYGQLGYGIKAADFKSGLFSEAGIGYFLPVKSGAQHGFKFRVGVNHKQMKIDDAIEHKRTSFAVGIAYSL